MLRSGVLILVLVGIYLMIGWVGIFIAIGALLILGWAAIWTWVLIAHAMGYRVGDDGKFGWVTKPSRPVELVAGIDLNAIVWTAVVLGFALVVFLLSPAAAQVNGLSDQSIVPMTHRGARFSTEPLERLAPVLAPAPPVVDYNKPKPVTTVAVPYPPKIPEAQIPRAPLTPPLIKLGRYPQRLIGMRTLPPPEYDHHYEGWLSVQIINTLEELRAKCNQQNTVACARRINGGEKCLVYMLKEGASDRMWTYEITLRHELGHCNGWPPHHPDAQPVPRPE